ncbi:major facilitator superfamily domain-containing protein [Neurospora tetraspora]|uniref:Major facilitator superfamily domain-containing protein n=1 Tax=Neurospora tetraspora TaxID=94610 RepID=A0AAE0MN67_9PEZI|nr:major facilitator superfamily domain-containing protein [Neurospora tetraspora]
MGSPPATSPHDDGQAASRPSRSPGLAARLRSYFRPGTPSSPLERRLLLKIDFFILTFCCLSYFLNYLDRTALSNAYVSGMKESLSFRGNQLNQINTCFTIGYVLGQIPSNLSLHYVAPRVFFPGMMVLWAGLTMVTAAARRPGDIMAIRFFQGVAESTTFVGTHYILGSWYTEQELGKRSGVFTASGLAGTMIGGFVQSGIHASMDGLRGLAGWRWLFIIDGIITLPVAIYGFLLFPDTPKTTRAPYLSGEERELAVRRMEGPMIEEPERPSNETLVPEVPPSPSASRAEASAKPVDDKPDSQSRPEPSPPTSASDTNPSSNLDHHLHHHPSMSASGTAKTEHSLTPTHPFSLPFARSLFSSYHFPSFILLWILAGETESFSSNALLSLYLKSHPSNPSNPSNPSPSNPSPPVPPVQKYTIAQLNNYPTGVPAVGIVSTLFFAFITDLYPRHRSIVGYFIGMIGILTPSLILAAQKGHFGDPAGSKATGVVMAMYYLAGSVYACQATFFAWANDAMTRDGKEPVFRGVVLAGMNLGNNAVNAWWSIVFYGAAMAPWFERGMWAMIGTSIALAAWTAFLSSMEKRSRRRRERELKEREETRRIPGGDAAVGPSTRDEKGKRVDDV